MGTSRSTSIRSSSLRFAVATAAVAVLLGACSRIGNADLLSIGEMAKRTIRPERVSLDEAATVPYASMGLRLGGSSEVMLVLGSNEDGEQLWTSSNRVVIITRDGRVVRTGGLGQDLGGSQINHSKQNPDGSSDIRWLADYPNYELFGVVISCFDAPPKDDTIEILGKSLKTVRIDERCTTDDSNLGWSFRNVFWRDPTSGLVWRSYQHISPRLGVLKIEVFRPPE